MGNAASKNSTATKSSSLPSSSNEVTSQQRKTPNLTISEVEPAEPKKSIPLKYEVYSIKGKKLKLDTDKDVESIIKEISACDLMTSLDFSGNTIGVSAAESLSKALANQKNLQDINLSDCFTGRLREEVPAALKHFSNVFMHLEQLKTINLSDNALGPAGAKAISELISNVSSLELLILNNNGLGPDGGNIIAESLLLLQQNSISKKEKSNLRKVMIDRNRLENGSASNIGTALQLHGLLEEVSLSQDGIRPEGISALCRALSHCHHLKMLELQDNTFSNEGALALAAALPSWPDLKVLNVGDCLLGSQGSKAVLEVLLNKENHSLETINLQYNEIDEFGAALIGDNLKNLKNLQNLMLNGNSFNPKGLAANLIRTAASANKITLDEWDEMEYTESEYTEEEESMEEANKEKEESIIEQIKELTLKDNPEELKKDNLEELNAKDNLEELKKDNPEELNAKDNLEELKKDNFEELKKDNFESHLSFENGQNQEELIEKLEKESNETSNKEGYFELSSPKEIIPSKEIEKNNQDRDKNNNQVSSDTDDHHHVPKDVDHVSDYEEDDDEKASQYSISTENSYSSLEELGDSEELDEILDKISTKDHREVYNDSEGVAATISKKNKNKSKNKKALSTNDNNSVIEDKD